MTRFVEIPLPDGGSLVVEVAEDLGTEVVPAGHARELAAGVAESFESALERIRDAAAAVAKRMRSLDPQPGEVTVEFAVKLGAQAGVVIAKSAVEANLTVRLRWNGSDPP